MSKFTKDLGKIEQAAERAVERAERGFERVAEDATDIVAEAELQASSGARSLVSSMGQFFKMEASGGIILVVAAIAALIVANSFMAPWYDNFLNHTSFRIGFSTDDGFDLELRKSILLWINDGLMAVFFFLIGLEIKREVVKGELSTRERAILPALAAVGGMAMPAVIYMMFNMGNDYAMRGWAIPAATDIAFALGVLSLAGKYAPFSLKVLLTAIAVIDDLGAIIIIALFYSDNIYLGPLYYAGAALLGLFLLNRRGFSHPAGYVILGIVLWIAVLKSGVHATLAGVVTALFIPMVSAKRPNKSPCASLEHALHPWVAFAVLPIFAFANAGVPFTGMSLEEILNPVTLGIAAGLVFGKQFGIFTVLWLTIKAGISPKPEGANWWQLYAVSVLCGIGFTMSLFIGGLAFTGVEMQASVRVGVMAGSVVSAFFAFWILRYGPGRAPAPAIKRPAQVPPEENPNPTGIPVEAEKH